MSYQQIVQPNLNVAGTVGDCLAYAREMFGAPGGVTWAWQAWENAKYKHSASEALPTDVDVLLWYSYKGTEGHVTVNVVGRGIYSSPYQRGTTHAVLASIADVERIYGVVYVGWSEDVNGVRVCEPIAAPTPAPAAGQTLHLPAAAATWRVYNVAGPYTVGHEVATLKPAKFGGLSYAIEKWIVPGSICEIKTAEFGDAAIYVANGTGATFS